MNVSFIHRGMIMINKLFKKPLIYIWTAGGVFIAVGFQNCAQPGQIGLESSFKASARSEPVDIPAIVEVQPEAPIVVEVDTTVNTGSGPTVHVDVNAEIDGGQSSEAEVDVKVDANANLPKVSCDPIKKVVVELQSVTASCFKGGKAGLCNFKLVESASLELGVAKAIKISMDESVAIDQGHIDFNFEKAVIIGASGKAGSVAGSALTRASIQILNPIGILQKKTVGILNVTLQNVGDAAKCELKIEPKISANSSIKIENIKVVDAKIWAKIRAGADLDALLAALLKAVTGIVKSII